MTMKRLIVFALGAVLSAPLQAATPKILKKEIAPTSKSKRAVELFKTGRDRLDNIRFAEAEKAFQEALELDPDFPLALAYLGSLQGGTTGHTMLQKAVGLYDALPEAERLVIEALATDLDGGGARSRAIREKIVALAPNDWHAHFELGQQLVGERKWAEAVRHLERATALNPAAGSAFNTLGYAHLPQRETDKAIEAFRKYASLNPQEPNPLDSLGEAFMMAGRFPEAEQAFMEALRIQPTFFAAWEGIAMSRFLRGQWDPGAEALAKAEAAATRPVDRANLKNERAWMEFARGDSGAAFRMLDSLERDAEREDLTTFAFVPITRATFYNQMNRPLQALQQTDVARQRGTRFPRITQAFVDSLSARVDLESNLILGRLAEARQAAARLRELAVEYPQLPLFGSAAKVAEGHMAIALGETMTGLAHFTQCIPEDMACAWDRFVAENIAGDHAASDATRKRILSANYRDPTALLVVSKLK
jgi:tetratricopeptide (TPR) repeat protein